MLAKKYFSECFAANLYQINFLFSKNVLGYYFS